MKLLLNDKEIANFLASLIDVKDILSKIPYERTNVEGVIAWAIERKAKKGSVDSKKLKDKLDTAVHRDTKNYMSALKAKRQYCREFYIGNIRKHFNYFINKLGEERVLNLYKNSKKDGFVKSVGFRLDRNAVLVRRKYFNSPEEDCVLRNTVGNENLLVSKIDNKLPFWFIDSGYTNFIESNKIWHRLVHNHLHYGRTFEAPVDRLGIFKTFPQKWRKGGDKILVIEPGEFAAAIFHIDIDTWKQNVEQELRQYTDRPIVFREKAPKKKRAPLYKHLLDEDYYCVISINSNAATEAIWAGVPVITLDEHVTNPVSRRNISDINNLYRGPLAEWLAMLSYSQFTYEELVDGTAAKIIKKYHV